MNHHNKLCPIVVWGVRQLLGTYGQFLDKNPTFTISGSKEKNIWQGNNFEKNASAQTVSVSLGSKLCVLSRD